MLLTALFWICLSLPGYALSRRLWPAAAEGGLLGVIATSYLASFLALSPLSMLGYALGAPLWMFSTAVALVCALGLAALLHARAWRELSALLRSESPAGWLLLCALLWLQLRVGAYFDGDATFHLGRVRVLLQHGFTNRDIYLADYYFQHIYHTNLLYPVYASLAQLTQQSYLEIWFHSQLWAKLLVAAGHYVLGHAVTRRPLAGWLLALCVVTANAGETYTVYPNTLAVGWLLPLVLAGGYALLARDARLGSAGLIAAGSFVLGQVHALYALYAGLVLAPALLVLGPAARWRGARLPVLLGLLGLFAGAPFLLVSHFGLPKLATELFAPSAAETAASAPGGVPGQPSAAEPEPLPPPIQRSLPDVSKGKPIVPTPAVAAGGGHLEKSLELDPRTAQVWFAPENMGGRGFIALCAVGYLLALWRLRDRRGPLAAAGASALLLAGVLFVPRYATLALEYLQQPFTVARLSTVLSTLLLLGAAAALSELGQRITKWRRLVEALVLVLAVGVTTQLRGHAPLFFSEVVQAARAPQAQRHAWLERLEARRALLGRVIPPGTTILTTARFARSVVMLCDCYVIAADRGHTRVDFIRLRRDHLVKLNGPNTPWPERSQLLQRYQLQLVVFESRHLARLYRWTRQHGDVIGKAAGLEVVRLR